MLRVKVKAALVTFVLLYASCAQAGSVLSYVGESFTTIHPSVGAGNVVAVFEIDSQITNGTILGPADVTSWSISAAGRTIDSLSAFTFFDAEFRIGPALLPDSWAFIAEANLEGSNAPESIYSLLGPESVVGTGVGTGISGLALDDGSPGPFTASASFSRISDGTRPGTWTRVPEPSAHLFMCIAALVVWGTRAGLGRTRVAAEWKTTSDFLGIVDLKKLFTHSLGPISACIATANMDLG